MTKRKHNRLPILPPHGDTGPDTPAQRAGAEYLEDTLPSGQKTTRKRREHILEIMVRGSDRRPAMITKRQCAAGLALLDRWSLTMLSPSPAWTRVYIDASPRPGDVNVAQLEAKSKYERINSVVPRESKTVIFQVVCENRSIRPGITNSPKEAAMLVGLLRNGLNEIAQEFSI